MLVVGVSRVTLPELPWSQRRCVPVPAFPTQPQPRSGDRVIAPIRSSIKLALQQPRSFSFACDNDTHHDLCFQLSFYATGRVQSFERYASCDWDVQCPTSELTCTTVASDLSSTGPWTDRRHIYPVEFSPSVRRWSLIANHRRIQSIDNTVHQPLKGEPRCQFSTQGAIDCDADGVVPCL
jgi:hypothetical protein